MIRGILVAASMVLMAPPALAQASLAEARAAGQVGERYDGYLGAASALAPTVRSQINAVNIKRRALYSQLARQRGVAPGDVGLTAGCELLSRVAAGEAYLLADGQWRRRSTAEGAPRPAYCG